MDERAKVFVIVYRRRGRVLEFLALKPNPEPGRSTDYYVITGGIEQHESAECAAQREVTEGIGVTPVALVDLERELRYQDHITGERFVEHCFGAEIQGDVKVLNEEYTDYRWLSLLDFQNTIWWEGKREDLGDMLGKLAQSAGIA